MMFNFAAFNSDVIHDLVDNNAINVLLLIAGSQLFFYFGCDSAEWATSRSRFKTAFDSVFIAVLIVVCIFNRAPSNTFIYFQF